MQCLNARVDNVNLNVSFGTSSLIHVLLVVSLSVLLDLQVLWLTICTALVGYVKPEELKQFLNKYVSIMCFGILSRAISSVITYHNEENRPKTGICVANHTSPIDVLILMCDNSYSLVGVLKVFCVKCWSLYLHILIPALALVL